MPFTKTNKLDIQVSQCLTLALVDMAAAALRLCLRRKTTRETARIRAKTPPTTAPAMTAVGGPPTEGPPPEGEDVGPEAPSALSSNWPPMTPKVDFIA